MNRFSEPESSKSSRSDGNESLFYLVILITCFFIGEERLTTLEEAVDTFRNIRELAFALISSEFSQSIDTPRSYGCYEKNKYNKSRISSSYKVERNNEGGKYEYRSEIWLKRKKEE